MAHVRRLVVLTAVVAGLLCLPNAAWAERTLGLSSLSFKFSSAIGGGGKGSVVVSNSGDEDLTVLVYVADQLVNDKGQIEYVVPNRDQIDFRNPASWFSLKMPADTKAIGNTPYLELSPGEQVPVDFSFTVPADARSGDNTVVLFFEMATLNAQGEGTISTVSGRIGTRITIRVEGTIREAVDVRPFTVPRIVFDNRVPYSFAVRNGGNIDEIINADVEMLTPDGEQVAGSRVATETTLFATEVKEIAGEIVPPATTVGRRIVRAIVTYVPQAADPPVEQRLVEERQVWLVPLWLAILVGGTALVALLWVVWRLGMRSQRRKRERQLQRAEERRRRRAELAARLSDDEADA